MQDIYDLKNIFISFIYSLDYINIIFILIFFLIFYLILNYFLNYKETKKELKYNKTDMNQLIFEYNYLQNNIESLEKYEFYNKTLNILKKIIYKKYGDENIFSASLKEISLKYNIKFFELLKQTYLLNFKDKNNDNISIREKILEELKKALKI